MNELLERAIARRFTELHIPATMMDSEPITSFLNTRSVMITLTKMEGIVGVIIINDKNPLYPRLQQILAEYPQPE